jgi:hypothetical protein
MTTVPASVRARAAHWLTTAGSAAPSLLPGLVIVALALVWAVHNGGFDADTWYWGALVTLATLTVVGVLRLGSARALPGPIKVALLAFAAYVAWSYLSIAWAQAPGTALQGSNRALLYLTVFAVMALIPWQTRTALAALVVFSLGLGVIALVLLLRLASADSIAGLFNAGRLAAPTGYFNSNAALFTMGALTATSLACRREVPALLRGLLVGAATATLPLAVLAQSRGWLFTLPLIVLVTVIVVPGRVRFVLTALMPAIATAISAHKLVSIFNDTTTGSLNAGARSIGREALILIVVTIVITTLAAWAESLLPRRPRVRPGLRVGGAVALAVVVIGGGAVGVVKATHNDPVGFVKREWNGFSHPVKHFGKGSYFATVGSGRYDFWRVALDAFTAHPIGGLGQDNFDDYYVSRRHTQEEPLWTHSLELRLLAHTGLIGLVLFAVFLGAGITAAVRARRRGPPVTGIIAASALLPAVVWLIHGSIDWFWEMPALTGPALGFLAMAGALSAQPRAGEALQPRLATPGGGRRFGARVLVAIPALLLLVAATVVLTLPYLSVREVSLASDVGSSNPAAALHDLKRAADLNPLDADASTRAGLLALSTGENRTARRLFAQAIDRDPGAWLTWLGAGLADSALGARRQAAQALRHAYAINDLQPPIKVALRRVFSSHPLSYAQAVRLFVIAR